MKKVPGDKPIEKTIEKTDHIRSLCVNGIFIIFITLIIILIASACSEQSFTRSYGGETTIYLPANEKLEEITWKDDSLWYLTRPMRDWEVPETHIFQQSSPYGIIEGTVTIIESEDL